MACNATDIPTLSFPRNEIIEIIPASYNNHAKRIYVPDLPPEIIPASPEGIKIPVPPSGMVSPFNGLGTPRAGAQSPAPNENGTTSPTKPWALNPKEPGEGTQLLIERALRNT